MSGMFGQPARPAAEPPAVPRRSRALVITAAVLLAGFLLLTAFASFWTERQWFDSFGFGGVFSTLLWTRVGLFVTSGVVMGAFVALNMYLAYRFRPYFRPASSEQDNLDRYRGAVTPLRGWLLAGVSVVLGLFAGASGAGQWREFTLWRNSVPFGTKDPFFDRDVSYYVFELPWWHYVVDFTMAVAVIGLLAAAVVHYLYGGIRLQVSRDRLSPAAQAQFSALLGLFVLAKGVDYWLDRFDLLNEEGSLITGMNFTDDKAVLPAKNILLGISIICAVLFFLNIWRKTWVLPSVGVALLALSAILLGLIWPGVVQRFQVSPSEPDKEAPYIEKNIAATRAAYGIDDVDVKRYTSAPELDAQLAALDADTSSVPLVDPQLVKQTFEQQQQVRAYYTVADVLDVDRYTLGGQERAMVLGVRELDQEGLAPGDRNWSNLHTVYTHGTGMIAAYANQRPGDNRSQAAGIQWAEGQEDGQSALAEMEGEPYEPRVYFGELSPSYSIVGKASDGPDVELDLPQGDEDDTSATTTYDGDAGVPVGGLFNKLLYAVKFGEPNMLLSSRVNENSKILYDRNPRRMVEKVAPWLTVDADPYPVVVDGRIQWILDGYTVTDQYPQSERESFEDMTDDSLQQAPGFQTLPTDEVNYVRNAVKATVDAYDGTVKLYAWDEEDPILQAWRGAFPDVVQDKDEIPESLMSHLRYPEDLFKAQRFQFARYHVQDPKDWYQNNNRWEVPEDPNDKDNQQPPYRLFLNQQAEGEEEPAEGQVWSLTSVYVPRDKANLAAFVSVNSDANSPDYGKIEALELADERTNGPALVANEIASDEDVRDELFSFDQGGINPRYGNLLTMPVGDGLMYVQPLYAARDASESSYPILSFVLVSYGGRVGIDTTLRGAIADVLGVEDSETATPTEPEGGEETPSEPAESVDAQVRKLLDQAAAKFEEAGAAQREGDTVGWAEAIADAEALIDEAVELTNE